MPVGVDYSKWAKIEDDEDDDMLQLAPKGMRGTRPRGPQSDPMEEACIQRAYAAELGEDEQPVDRLKELKIKMAVDAYEQRRPKDKICHHYWIKDCGDPMAIGEYFPTGDDRNDCPMYRNQNGLVLSREAQPKDDDPDEDMHGWIIGSMEDRRPLYGVMCEDLSVPTLGWQAFTAPEPVPTVRYYTHASAARVFKERGNKSFSKKDYVEAEEWYSKALACKMDPMEYAEPMGMILSNRAEVRLRMQNFDGAAGDAGDALRHLRVVTSDQEGTQLLKQKTFVRRSKALQALKRFTEMKRCLKEAHAWFPENQEIDRLMEEAELSLKAEAVAGRGGKVTSAAVRAVNGATEELLRYFAKTLETMQAEVANAGDKISDFTLPAPLATALKKLEYTLTKAKSVTTECLVDLQTVLRTNGGMRSLLQIVKAQWISNLEGKIVDTFKLQALSSVTTIISLACDGCVENLKTASAEATSFFGALGGCNRKVETDACERLVALVAMLWEQCRSRTIELTQTHSIVVERAATFLSKVVLAELTDDASGPDAPTVADNFKEQALNLLFEWLGAGGRIEKRTLRGVVPQLAGPEGVGFFTAEQAPARSLGELIICKVIADPALLSTREVTNLLSAIQLLVVSGPFSEADEADLACLAFDEFKSDTCVMRYVDLDGWETTEAGKHTSLILQATSKALEFRLLKKERELEKDNFEDAFFQGNGFFIVVPLVQGPAAFAEHALLCLSVIVRQCAENVNHVVGLSTIQALLGLPSPAPRPMPSQMDQVLKHCPNSRRHAAKILALCTETQVMMDLLRMAGEKVIKELVKLAIHVREDGKGNLESFHDMLHVFYLIAQFRPGPLCRHIPVDMLNFLVDLSKGNAESRPAFYATGILQMLMRDPECEKKLLPIINRGEGWSSYEPEDDLNLLNGLTPVMNQID